MRISDWSSEVCSSDLLRLKPGADRERTSVEFERAMAPRLQAIPDARISFQSQSSGTGRDITIMLASNDPAKLDEAARNRSEEHTSELQSLMRISYAVFCLKQKTANKS